MGSGQWAGGSGQAAVADRSTFGESSLFYQRVAAGGASPRRAADATSASGAKERRGRRGETRQDPDRSTRKRSISSLTHPDIGTSTIRMLPVGGGSQRPKRQQNIRPAVTRSESTAQRLGAHECTDVVAPRKQHGDQSATDVAGAPRYKYLSLNSRGYYFELIDFPLRCAGGTMAGIESSHLLLVSTC